MPHDKQPKITLDRDGKRRPVLHVLMADGRVTEFRHAVVVIPESPRDEADTRVFGLLVNGRGEPYVDANGDYILAPAIPLTLAMQTDADRLLSYEEVARRAGVSLSTVKREVGRGELPKPTQISSRRVGLKTGDVESWLAGKRRA